LDVPLRIWRSCSYKLNLIAACLYQREKMVAVRRSLRPVAIVVVVLSTAVAFGQTKGDEPVKTVRITGQVTDRLHEPIANAAVALKVEPSTEPGFSVGFTRAVTTTDLNGKFTFPAVPPGDYILHFESSGFALLEMRIAAVEDLELANIVMDVGLMEGPADPPFNVSPIGQKLEEDSEEPITTNLCELVKTPERFNGRLIQIRAEYVSKFQWEGLVDESCSATLQVGIYHPLDDLKPDQGQYAFTTIDDDNTHPERLTWKPIPLTRPVHLKQDDDYWAFRKYAYAKFRWPDAGVCVGCPLYRLNVTATGRFDHFETNTVTVRATPSTKPFHYSTDPDNPLSRFVLQSVSEVSVNPIEVDVYNQTKRRDVSLEEAHDLVTAFFTDRGSTKLPGFGLDKYNNKHYPEFQFFQGIFCNPKGSFNLGHYAVDRKTGDVWNAVICERVTSPSLAKLQRAIRKRIVLTDLEYRKAQRPGPMCEPGMPRMPKGK
jgi:hypothetical protein